MKVSRVVLPAVFGILVFFVSMCLAWMVMAKFDFFYGVWHDHGGIKEGIENYGPKNRYRKGFADTTKIQRLSLFSQINESVHNGGKGLGTISYQSPSSGGRQSLLRRPEIIHLQDVANLIDLMAKAVVVIVVTWFVFSAVYIKRFASIPKVRQQLFGVGAILMLSTIVLSLIGPETVFNTLHIWIFPGDHQWHFYYQDSLMSTMMLAPRLFAWIAATWLIFAILGFFLVNMMLWLSIHFVRKKCVGRRA